MRLTRKTREITLRQIGDVAVAVIEKRNAVDCPLSLRVVEVLESLGLAGTVRLVSSCVHELVMVRSVVEPLATVIEEGRPVCQPLV